MILGSDEKGCSICSASNSTSDSYFCEFGKRCIPAEKICDNINDCSDGGDEDGCAALVPRGEKLQENQVQKYVLFKHILLEFNNANETIKDTS